MKTLKLNSKKLIKLFKFILLFCFYSLITYSAITENPFKEDNFSDIQLNLSNEIDFYAKDWVQTSVINNPKFQEKIKENILKQISQPLVIPENKARGGLSDFAALGLGTLSDEFYQKSSEGKSQKKIGKDSKLSVQFDPQKTDIQFEPGELKISNSMNNGKKTILVEIPIEKLEVNFSGAQVGASYIPTDNNVSERKFVDFCSWIGCQNSVSLPEVSGKVGTDKTTITFEIELPKMGELEVDVKNMNLNIDEEIHSNISFEKVPEQLKIEVPTTSIYGNSQTTVVISKEAFKQTEVEISRITKKNIASISQNEELTNILSEVAEVKIESEINNWISSKKSTPFELPIPTDISFIDEIQELIQDVNGNNDLLSGEKRKITTDEQSKYIATIKELKSKINNMGKDARGDSLDAKKDREVLSTALVHAFVLQGIQGNQKEQKETLNLINQIWDKKGIHKKKYKDISEKDLNKIKSILLGHEGQLGSLDEFIQFLSNDNNELSEELISSLLSPSNKQLQAYDLQAQVDINPKATNLSDGVIGLDLLINQFNTKTGEFEAIRPSINCEGIEPPLIRYSENKNPNDSEIIIPLQTINTFLTYMDENNLFETTLGKGIKLLQAPVLTYNLDPLNPEKSKLKLNFPIETDSAISKVPVIGFFARPFSAKNTYNIEIDIDITIDKNDPKNIVFNVDTQHAKQENKLKNFLSILNWAENIANFSSKISTNIAKRYIDREISTENTGIPSALDTIQSEFRDVRIDQNQNIRVAVSHNGVKNE